MKAGVTTSVVLHAVVLAFGLFTLSAPPPMNVADVESLPVDIVPIEQLTQIQQGDKKSKVNDKPAPKPTQRPDIVADAKTVGDNSVDTDKPPTPDPKPVPKQAAAVPEPQPKPVEKPDPQADQPEDKKVDPLPTAQVPPKPEPAPPKPPEPKPEQVKPPEPKPQPVKQPDVKPEPKPAPVQEAKPVETPKTPEQKIDPIAQEIASDPKPVEKPVETTDVALPKSAPAPEVRPQAQQPVQQVQATPTTTSDKKDQQKPQSGAKAQSTDKAFDTDQVAALLDKQKPSGGGAKRSTQTASLGGDKSTGGSKLSQSEMDALRGQVEKCWSVPAGANDGGSLRVSIKFKLDRSGALDGSPEIVSGGGAGGVERAAAESARRAVQRCAPYNLPADKYEAWADVIVNFDPSDMF